MYVQAPSNEAGVTQAHDTFVDSDIGWDYSSGDYTSEVPRSVVIAESVKSETLKGDRIHALPYRRTITRLMANKPYVYRTTSRHPVNGIVTNRSIHKRHLSNQRSIVGTFIPPRFEVLDDDAFAESSVKALNKLQQHKLQLGVDLLEARKTVNQLAGLARSTILTVGALRRGNLVGAYRHLRGRGISSRYLEGQYGIRPLMQTMEDSFKIAIERLNRPLLLYGKSTHKWKDEFSSSDGPVSSRITGKGGTKTFIAARVDTPWLAELNQLGLVNPLSIAWEVIPFSFVLDWFIPVGNVLEAITATYGLTLVDGYQTRFHDMSHQESYNSRSLDYRLDTGLRETTDDGFWWKQFKYVRRYPLPSFPSPRFYAKDNPFSTSHVLSALALLRDRHR